MMIDWVSPRPARGCRPLILLRPSGVRSLLGKGLWFRLTARWRELAAVVFPHLVTVAPRALRRAACHGIGRFGRWAVRAR
jgi:hypothetical protein